MLLTVCGTLTLRMCVVCEHRSSHNFSLWCRWNVLESPRLRCGFCARDFPLSEPRGRIKHMNKWHAEEIGKCARVWPSSYSRESSALQLCSAKMLLRTRSKLQKARPFMCHEMLI